jgi:hypothetical protein
MDCEFVDPWIWKPDLAETEYGTVAVYPWAPLSVFGLS